VTDDGEERAEVQVVANTAEARRRQMEEDARGLGFDYDAEGGPVEAPPVVETDAGRPRPPRSLSSAEAQLAEPQDSTAVSTGDVNTGAAEATQIIADETGRAPHEVHVGGGIGEGAASSNAGLKR
jgi:hypothetical protein